MQHVRRGHSSHFTVVGNHLAQRKGRAATIGIGVYIQSLPDGAPVSIKDLARHFDEGEVTIAACLRDLEKDGYLTRTRMRTSGGKVWTYTVSYDRPGVDAAPESPHPRPISPPVAEATPPPPPLRVVEAPRPKSAPQPQPPPREPLSENGERAAVILASLRIVEPRLLLSQRDVRKLVPLVEQWLARGTTNSQITHALTAGLPDDALRWPARVLEYRLTEGMPPALPARETAAAAVPLQNCDACDRAFRSSQPGQCRDCRA